jgi:uncharacterized protein YjbJ (UPF0337 family)
MRRNRSIFTVSAQPSREQAAEQVLAGTRLASSVGIQEVTIMSTIDDKARGTGNDAVGNVKQVVGNVTGNERLEREGEAQETKGEAQQALGHAKEAVGNALQSAANAIKGSGK